MSDDRYAGIFILTHNVFCAASKAHAIESLFSDFPHPKDPPLYYPADHSNYPQRGEVAIYAGEKRLFTGKWQHGFHSRIFALADHRQQTISVRRAADNQLLFSVDPYPEVI